MEPQISALISMSNPMGAAMRGYKKIQKQVIVWVLGLFSTLWVLCFLAALLSVSGCALSATSRELAAADYGTAPRTPEMQIHQWVEDHFKDPDSARYRKMTAPYKDSFRLCKPICTGGNEFGWDVAVEINAKNSAGGYVGYRQYYFLFRGDDLVDVAEPLNY